MLANELLFVVKSKNEKLAVGWGPTSQDKQKGGEAQPIGWSMKR